jgi:hypothetical protein
VCFWLLRPPFTGYLPSKVSRSGLRWRSSLIWLLARGSALQLVPKWGAGKWSGFGARKCVHQLLVDTFLGPYIGPDSGPENGATERCQFCC